MLPKTPMLFSLLTIFIIFSSITHGVAESDEYREGRNEDDVVMFSRGTKRIFAEAPNIAEPPALSSPLILAPKRTYRKDPLNGFKKYTGGWNINDRHYWASVAYTAVPFFVAALIWFVIFGLCLLLVGLCYRCCRREPYGYSQMAYALSLIFLVLFTIAAMY